MCGKNLLTLSKRHLFVIEKYIEDLEQDEKNVPDLLESIMKPPGLVNKKLQSMMFEIIQIRSKIQEFRVSTFWIPEIQSFPVGGQCQPSR